MAKGEDLIKSALKRIHGKNADSAIKNFYGKGSGAAENVGKKTNVIEEKRKAMQAAQNESAARNAEEWQKIQSAPTVAHSNPREMSEIQKRAAESYGNSSKEAAAIEKQSKKNFANQKLREAAQARQERRAELAETATQKQHVQRGDYAREYRSKVSDLELRQSDKSIARHNAKANGQKYRGTNPDETQRKRNEQEIRQRTYKPDKDDSRFLQSADEQLRVGNDVEYHIDNKTGNFVDGARTSPSENLKEIKEKAERELRDRNRGEEGAGIYVNGNERSEAQIKAGKTVKANGRWMTPEEAERRGITVFQEDLRPGSANNGSSQKAAEAQTQVKKQSGGSSKNQKQSGNSDENKKQSGGGFFDSLTAGARSHHASNVYGMKKKGYEIINSGSEEDIKGLFNGAEISPETLKNKKQLLSLYRKQLKKEAAGDLTMFDYVAGNPKTVTAAGSLAVGLGVIASVSSNGGRRSNSSLYGSPY